MVAERCVFGDTRWVATWRWQLQMKICRNWASLQSTVESRMSGTNGASLWRAPSSTVDRCREPSGESRHEHCDDESHSHRGCGDSSQETFPRLGDGRERTSTGSDQWNHRHERSIGMASVDHEIRAKHSAESTKSHERSPQCKDLSLRAHSIRNRTGRMAREHSQVGIDIWRLFQRVNEESSLSWQSTFIGASPTSDAEPGYLRSDDSSDSSVPATQRTVSCRCDSDTNNRRGPDDMEIDSLKKKGKGKSKGKSKTDGSKTSCFVCGRAGHMSKDCWFEDTSKGSAPNNKGKKGKGKGKGKNSVNEVTTLTESPTPPGGNSTSQISRIIQDDTWDRLVTMDEDEDGEYETGYILAAIRHRETFKQYKDWKVVRVLVDNCADEHVCSPRDFEWIAIEPSRNPHLVSASGHKLKHYGEQAVPMKFRDGRKIWITFQVCEVDGPIMSVGKFCAKGNDRCATFSTRGGFLWHEEVGEIAVDRVRNHYEMECWIKPGNVLAPVEIGGSSGSAGEPAGHHVAVPQRTNAEILMDAQPQGAYAPRADEEHIEPEILPVASLPGPREPSKDEIEKHNLLHDPAMPWCDICIQTKSRDGLPQTDKTESPSSDSVRFRGCWHTAWTTTFRLHGRNWHEPRCSLGINCFGQRQRGSIHCLIDSLMVVRARTFKSHHPVRRWASVRSCHAHGAIERCHDGTSTMWDHPTATTEIQPPEQRRGRTDGADDTQSDQSLQNPNRKELRNHHQSRQPSTHLVTTTRSMAIHEIPQKTRLNDNSIR